MASLVYPSHHYTKGEQMVAGRKLQDNIHEQGKYGRCGRTWSQRFVSHFLRSRGPRRHERCQLTIGRSSPFLNREFLHAPWLLPLFRPRIHWIATTVVALGDTRASFCILFSQAMGLYGLVIYSWHALGPVRVPLLGAADHRSLFAT